MNESLWTYDQQYPRSGAGLIGVDEAGRGSLAGPVFAAAVYFPESSLFISWARLGLPKIDDSKKLSRKEREQAYQRIHELKADRVLHQAVGIADVNEIENYNILGATTIAMERAVGNLELTLKPSAMPLWTDREGKAFPKLLIDGRPVKRLPFCHTGLVRGDGVSLAIALASIIAKVERDRLMTRAHRDYPHYGWDRNAGYGTADHRRAIREFGACPLHRSLFLRKIIAKG